MHFASLTPDGPLVIQGRERLAAPSPHQDERFREAFWFHLATQGGYDPASGRSRPYRQAEIARLFDVSEATVSRGLASARQVRAQLAEVARG